MMHTLAITVVSLLSFTALTNAATLQLNNYCNTALWISDANPAIPAPPAFELPRRTAYVRSLEGVGNSLGVSKVSDYYNANTPKFILGSAVDQGRLWWTVNNIAGDPFVGQHFNVTSPIGTECGETTEYNLITHSCPDGDFTLEINTCFE